jgi:hypothetical protein
MAIRTGAFLAEPVPGSPGVKNARRFARYRGFAKKQRLLG